MKRPKRTIPTKQVHAEKLDRAASWTSEFERAYGQARFSDASEIYDLYANRAEDPGLVLKAAFARLASEEGIASAMSLLMNLHLPLDKPRLQVARDLALAETYGRSRDFLSADQRLTSARKAASILKDADLISEVGFRMVRRHLFEGSTESARHALDLVRRGSSRRSRVLALWTESLVLSREGRPFDEAQRLMELLRFIDPSDRGPIEAFEVSLISIRTAATSNLSLLTRELYIPNAIAEVERQIAGTEWPKDYTPVLFQALKALAWAKALQGDYFSAFRHLLRASEEAKSAAWKVVAACDRAFLARYFGEPGWSRAELNQAEQLANEVDWPATLRDERTALLLLAELFAEIDTARSSMYLVKYRSLGEIRSPLVRQDSRTQAFAQYSTGVVELALGNQRRGLTELREACVVFERFGYDFRAARCLVSEYRATANRRLLPAIAEKLRHYEHSWLAEEVRGAPEGPRTSLSTMQQAVFEELCQGKSTAQIAHSLHRSESTISNHIREIFKTFGVKSRAALLAKVGGRT